MVNEEAKALAEYLASRGMDAKTELTVLAGVVATGLVAANADPAEFSRAVDDLIVRLQ